MVIDENGFRQNVGMIVVNREGLLLWARRAGSQDAWQFPQGGVHENETPKEAMFRELTEELGMQPSDVKILAESQEWLSYRLPKKFQRIDDPEHCIGQKQKWFLLCLISDEDCIHLDRCANPEFDQWKWVAYWFPLKQVIFFKRTVYAKILREFAPLVLSA